MILQPTCEVCKGTGMTGWEKPMRGLDGEIHMVFIPQVCWQCEDGKDIWLRSQHMLKSDDVR